jgi:thiol-disulfide isomerase/thioredoxin
MTLPFIRFAPRACLILLALCISSVTCGNPFSSNVVALTAKNWKEEVEESPHAVFVNMCRVGCGYCQLLTPEWEKLAAAVKGTIKVAYWDTEQTGRRPPLLGEIKGTPTIRLYVPKKKQGTGNRQKAVLDYNYERKAKDMKQFAEQNMPNFVEPIRGDLTSFVDKATRHGLPQVLLFTSKSRTSSLTKYLTTEFRRRLLVAEIYPTEKNKALMETYGVSKDNLPALLILREGAEPIKYDEKDFSRHKLHRFLSKYALKDAVVPKKKEEKKDSAKEETKKENLKVEL